MKRYVINYSFYASAEVVVLANSREEALQKGREVNIPKDDIDLEPDTETITEEKEVPELHDLIREAEAILQEADKRNITFTLDPWLPATILSWNGKDMQPSTELIESIFYDNDREEIGFETDHWSETTISELPETQQYDICMAIIEQAKDNGIII